MVGSHVLEGTWEELKLHDAELSGKRFRLVPLPSEPEKTAQEAEVNVPRQLTGLGKFAGILPSSEVFMRQKQEELALEERKLGG